MRCRSGVVSVPTSSRGRTAYEHGLLRALLPDAETAEEPVQDVVNADMPRDFAQRLCGITEFLCSADEIQLRIRICAMMLSSTWFTSPHMASCTMD